MGNLFYLIAIGLVMLWATGFYGFHAGIGIHLLLIFPIVFLLIRLLPQNESIHYITHG